MNSDQEYDFLELSDTDVREILVNNISSQKTIIDTLTKMCLIFIDTKTLSTYKILDTLIRNNFIKVAKNVFNQCINKDILLQKEIIQLICQAIKANQYTTTKILMINCGAINTEEKILIFNEIKNNINKLNVNILDIIPLDLNDYKQLIIKTSNPFIIKKILTITNTYHLFNKLKLSDIESIINRCQINNNKIIQKIIVKKELTEFITHSVLPISFLFGFIYISIKWIN